MFHFYKSSTDYFLMFYFSFRTVHDFAFKYMDILNVCSTFTFFSEWLSSRKMSWRYRLFARSGKTAVTFELKMQFFSLCYDCFHYCSPFGLGRAIYTTEEEDEYEALSGRGSEKVFCNNFKTIGKLAYYVFPPVNIFALISTPFWLINLLPFLRILLFILLNACSFFKFMI